MPREAVPSNNEREFVRAAIQEQTRLDGRTLDAFRPVSLSFNSNPNTYGTATVSIGKTRVLANVSCEVAKSYADRKFDGIFTISTELSPMAWAGFEVGRQDETELLLSRMLEKTIRRSNALDTESLCIIAGQKCFHVRADIHVLDHDGNILDAACLALVAALAHFRRPDFEVHGEDVKVFSVAERQGIKLSMQHLPFCTTFSLFPSIEVGMQLLLVDATLLEEQCRDGDILVSMNRYGEICQIAKYGGKQIDATTFLATNNLALEKVKAFDSLVKEELANDEKRRNAGGLMAELSAENPRKPGEDSGLVG
ncbi:hypothetical protein K431DRAFT_322697 [Polychaeton citri CBS 116435]|uniref:Exosome complex component RRP45 n=1 Tax=Polychaeton citri CBS 116435 TaxID=1314669 RepID=A0A9P4Q003_9PEZI|nr:hypothetical protein K431DRAFT_322697 [Polychaeton citri CBS 116435]